MEPIVPIVEMSKASSSPARGTLADLIASLIAGAAAIIAFVYSAVFFSRFLENDTHVWGVISAMLLCFGVGAFAYIPAGLTSLIAWKAHKTGAARRGLLIVVTLLMPWVALSLALLFVSDTPKLFSLSIFVTVLLLTFWALISLRKIKSK